MMDLTALLGQLLGLGFACGLNLYATVAALGIGSRLGVIDASLGGLRGLEHPIVLGSALALFLVEFVVDKVPQVNSAWDTIHTLIRPTAAASLALGLMAADPLQVQIAAAFLAAAVALLAHAGKAGLRMAINTTRYPLLGTVASLAEDAAAVALALLALRRPESAALWVLGSLLLTAVVGRRLWRAFGLGLFAVFARLRGLFRPSGWRRWEDVPGDLKALLAAPVPGVTGPRTARVGVKGVRGVGAYRSGWLVLSDQTRFFLYRSLLGPRRAELPPGETVQTRRGVWADALEVRGNGSRYTLFLLKDGPSPDLTEPELAPAHH